MSESNIFRENVEAMEQLRNKIRNFEMPKIDTGILDKIKIPDVSYEIKNFKNPLIELNEEQNSYLKALVKCNEDISAYNEELVSLNKKILNKINSLDDTLTFLNGAFSDKAKSDKENFHQHIALLLELTTIIEDKDSSKLKLFMDNVGAPVLAELLINFFKIKFGLTN